jgi:hypothetical protein
MNDELRPPFQSCHPPPKRADLAPLPIDVWTAASLLQKAIRRSDTTTALRAAVTLHRWRGTAMWRRLMIIAIEDVGVGCLDAVGRTVSIATDTALRRRVGDLPLIVNGGVFSGQRGGVKVGH